jgi:hypothetical protein
MLQTRLSLAAEPTQQQILLLAMETKPFGGKCSQFLELIGSVVVAVPADYTRYL